MKQRTIWNIFLEMDESVKDSLFNNVKNQELIKEFFSLSYFGASEWYQTLMKDMDKHSQYMLDNPEQRDASYFIEMSRVRSLLYNVYSEIQYSYGYLDKTKLEERLQEIINTPVSKNLDSMYTLLFNANNNLKREFKPMNNEMIKQRFLYPVPKYQLN